MSSSDALAGFSAPTRAWFEGAFEAPTRAQAEAWRALSSGRDALVVAPTGSGKTLAAFLSALDRLATEERPAADKRLRVLYVSPLKALAVDIERNLRAPLAGIRAAAVGLGLDPPGVTVAVRTGDTPQQERRRFSRAPSDILITTPESLFLLLTSAARAALGNVDTVILDEVHALAGTKRGAHLALSLERLDHMTGRRARRVGLSATVRPVEEVAEWLAPGRSPALVNPPSDKRFDLRVVVPVEDLAEMGRSTGEIAGGSAAGAEARTSIWPHVEEHILALIRDHKSSLVFANSRGLAERLCARLNDLAGEEIVRAHHGSVARDQRLIIEEELKAGRLPAVVATSSLELGIDMAAVDLVIQVEAPTSVASGLQRIGRAGHQVGEISRGVLFPKYRGDLLDCALVVERMQEGLIESISYPRNPLDVLAQHIVSMTAMDEWEVDRLAALVRGAAPFRELPDSAFEGVLDMLSGRYPSDEFAELRPRINWDRVGGRLGARPSARTVAITSGGTIPDRGLYGVFIAGERGSRVGELDEEMVYESRVGDTFVLGATSWLIEEIGHDRVLVSPAPGRPGRVPFWHGDAPGRPAELGRARGALVRDLAATETSASRARLERAGLDDFASANLVRYVSEQKGATGSVPDDRTIVVERFRDELGDWRVCVHSTFGARVNAPWALAIEAKVRERTGMEVQCIYSDDGIVVRITEADDAPPGDSVVIDPAEIEDVVVTQVASSALFAGRFRECAARALLLPRRRPGSRQPLWQQRQKSTQLLQVASRFDSFPIVLETYRECLKDVFDLPALVDVMSGIARRDIRVVEVDTPGPSPFAASLMFGFVGAFMYEGDTPVAERRAQALTLDRGLLAELLGHAELRELIDEDALASVELELQMLAEDYRARNPDELHDALRIIGDLSPHEIAGRIERRERAAEWIEGLERDRRILRVRLAGTGRIIAAEDAARARDGLGIALPVGVPAAFLEPVADPVRDLVARYARTHGPFATADVAARLGLPEAVVGATLEQLESESVVLRGEFRPGGRAGRMEWIDAGVLRRVRRRSLAAFRKEAEAVPAAALGRFNLEWHGVDPPVTQSATPHDLYRVLRQLEGLAIPASQLERQILAGRLPGYAPRWLDELCASGEVVWAGAGASGSDDGWIALATQESAALLPEPDPAGVSDTARLIEEALDRRGASFFRAIGEETASTDDRELLLALWELVWAGRVTNDTLGPLRALTGGVRARRPSRRRGPAFPARLGPPHAAGRWSLVVRRGSDPTRRLHAAAESLLARHGVLTRAAMGAENVAGGFAALYPVLRAMDETGRCRRGYFVEGLGGAQFALGGAVDRLRSVAARREEGGAVLLAAADPASPFGATLPWPEPATGSSHRAGRKAGASVVLVDGKLAFFVEKGGRSLVTYSADREVLATASDALADAVRRAHLGAVHLRRVDGEPALGAPLASVLLEAGFRQTSTGVRLRPDTANPSAGGTVLARG